MRSFRLYAPPALLMVFSAVASWFLPVELGGYFVDFSPAMPYIKALCAALTLAGALWALWLVWLEHQLEHRSLEGDCPRCGWFLKQKHGRHGPYWECRRCGAKQQPL